MKIRSFLPVVMLAVVLVMERMWPELLAAMEECQKRLKVQKSINIGVLPLR